MSAAVNAEDPADGPNHVAPSRRRPRPSIHDGPPSILYTVKQVELAVRQHLDDLLKPENKQKLISILTYHVVAGKVMAKDVVKLHEAKTVNGQDVKIMVEGGKVMADNSNVVKTDIQCTNGVIHVIDTVLMPQ